MEQTTADKIIQVDIRQGDIEISTPLAEFRDEVIKAIGSVTFTLTRKQFEKQVALAFDGVIQRIRDSR